MRGGECAGGHGGRRAHPHPVDGDPLLARTPAQRPGLGWRRGFRRGCRGLSDGGSARRGRSGRGLAGPVLFGVRPFGFRLARCGLFGCGSFGFRLLRLGLSRRGRRLRRCRAAGCRVVCRLDVGSGDQSVLAGSGDRGEVDAEVMGQGG